MAQIRIRTNTGGPERVIARAARALEPPLVSGAVREGAKVIQRGIAARAPRRSGRLARSFQIESVDAYTYDVASDLIYAPVHEYGATIRPRRATYLRFVVGGQVVFTKGPVVIPARPYVEPTAAADGDAALNAVADRIERNFNA